MIIDVEEQNALQVPNASRARKFSNEFMPTPPPSVHLETQQYSGPQASPSISYSHSSRQGSRHGISNSPPSPTATSTSTSTSAAMSIGTSPSFQQQPSQMNAQQQQRPPVQRSETHDVPPPSYGETFPNGAPSPQSPLPTGGSSYQYVSTTPMSMNPGMPQPAVISHGTGTMSSRGMVMSPGAQAQQGVNGAYVPPNGFSVPTCAQGRHTYKMHYGVCGIVTAIVCFPIGVVGLFVDRKRVCTKCGYVLNI